VKIEGENMDLETFRKSRRMSKRQLAKFLEMGETTLSNYLSGTRRPSLEIGRRIEILTQGEVRIDDLLSVKRRE